MTVGPATRAALCAAVLASGVSTAVLADAAVPSGLTAEPEPGVKAWHVVTAFTYLGVLAALGYGIVHYARRGRVWPSRTASSEAIRLVGTTRLPAAVAVSLLEVEGRRVLVASTATGVSMLELPKEGE